MCKLAGRNPNFNECVRKLLNLGVQNGGSRWVVRPISTNVSGSCWIWVFTTLGRNPNFNECFRKLLNVGVQNGGSQPQFQRMFQEIVEFGCAKRWGITPSSTNVSRNCWIWGLQNGGGMGVYSAVWRMGGFRGSAKATIFFHPPGGRGVKNK